jgi:copper chaperone CopZ
MAVRDILSAVPGVGGIQASSMLFTVRVEYDPTATSEDAIKDALDKAGYGVDQPLELSASLDPSRDGSSWYKMVGRISSTNQLDLEMSGDFRKY